MTQRVIPTKTATSAKNFGEILTFQTTLTSHNNSLFNKHFQF